MVIQQYAISAPLCCANNAVRKTTALFATCTALIAFAASAAHAISLSCEVKEHPNSPASEITQMQLTYKGGDSGVLHIKAAFGEMDVSAVKRSGDEGNGVITGISAFGETKALMPDQAALEDCVAAKLSTEQQADADLIFMQRMSCGQTTPIGAAAVPIKLTVAIAFDGKSFLTVQVTRTFLEKSRIGKEPIAVEMIPLPDCKIVDAS